MAEPSLKHLSMFDTPNYTNCVYNYTLSDPENASHNNSVWCVLNVKKTGRSFDPFTVLTGVLLGLIILFTIVGNVIVVTAVIRFRRLRKVTNFFVVSLAIADLTVAILVMPFALIYELQGTWRFGWIFCYFWISCDVTCCTASILHLCLIAMDRHLAIIHPLSYKARMSKRRALIAIFSVWACSMAISFLPIFLGWFVDPEKLNLYDDTAECGLFVNRPYAVVTSSASFFIPLVVMFISYVKIFRIAYAQLQDIRRQQMVFLQQQCTPDRCLRRKSRRHNRDNKALKTLGTLMTLFCVCWLPFFLMYLILPFCSSCHPSQLLQSFITWLGYINSCVNPCVYALHNSDFRLAYLRILGCRYMGKFGNSAIRTYSFSVTSRRLRQNDSEEPTEMKSNGCISTYENGGRNSSLEHGTTRDASSTSPPRL